jgi:6-phosphogluconolactonase (cycloisomerase 2 family)
MRRVLLLPLLSLALAACLDSEITEPGMNAAADLRQGGVPASPGAVYTLSNAVAGNAVLAFPRAADGTLGTPVSTPTGGTGTGGGLGNQGAVAVSADGRYLYAVNPGSHDISTFRVTPAGLELVDRIGSGGALPISLAVRGNLAYVLNDGAAPNVTGFRVGHDGRLTPIAGSTRPLTTAVPDAAQVGIAPDGTQLVVTEKATNTIVGWSITAAGTLTGLTLTASASPTPFGFDFSPRGALLVTEAVGGAPGASVLSSYRSDPAGWATVSPSTATTETAACWVVVTPNGRFAYVTNTGSASVSGFAIGHGGELTLLNGDGVTGTTGAGPIDATISHNGRFLYTLNAGADGISAFRIGADGSLTHLGDITGLPDGATGLVAR